MNSDKNRTHSFRSVFSLLITIVLCAVIVSSCGCCKESYSAITNVKLVPMTSEVILEHQTVLIEGDSILQISPSNQTTATYENHPRGWLLFDAWIGGYAYPHS